MAIHSSTILDGTGPVGRVDSIPHVRSSSPLGAVGELMRDQFGALERWRQDYGPLFVIDFGPLSFVIVANAQLASEMLIERGQELVREGKLYDSMKSVFGEVSLVTSDGPQWRERRRVAQPHFRQAAIAAISERVAVTVEDNFTPLRPGPLDFVPFSGELAMSVGLRVLFGQSTDAIDAPGLTKAIDACVNGIGAGWLAERLPRWLPLPGRRRFRRALAVVDDTLASLITLRRESGDYGDDMLGMLLHMADEGGMTARHVRNEAVALLIAGYETTGNALAWTFYEIARDPELFARLRAEADTVGAEALRDGSVEGPSRLPLAHRVFQEGLRKYPSVLWLPRGASVDTQLGGYPIAANTSVMLSPYLVQHDAEVWTDPERFDPERFAEDAAKPSQRFAFVAFGLGQHMCIGKHLALLEGVLAIARMAHDWDLAPIPARTPIQRISTTMRAKDGIWLELRRRA